VAAVLPPQAAHHAGSIDITEPGKRFASSGQAADDSHVEDVAVDALDLLTADHNRVRGLFHQFEQASEDDDRGRMEELAAKMRTELEVHTAIEEELFYPAVRELDDEIGETVAEGLEEHHEVKGLLSELVFLTPDDPAWKAKWTVITENVEHHAGEEESELFPQVRSKTDPAWRDEMGEKLDARKGKLGAPTLADRDELSAEDLRSLATAQDIPGRSKMSSTELRATVSPE
jgi:hemerythrin superfamily protein